MGLILSLGSNLGNKKKHLENALIYLSQYFTIVQESQIFFSEPTDYKNQPNFFNQLVQCELPKLPPLKILQIVKAIEKRIGRTPTFSKGPRIIDIDIIFLGNKIFKTKNLTIPHPKWHERSFILFPLKELPYYAQIKRHFIIPDQVDNMATPLGF